MKKNGNGIEEFFNFNFISIRIYISDILKKFLPYKLLIKKITYFSKSLKKKFLFFKNSKF